MSEENSRSILRLEFEKARLQMEKNSPEFLTYDCAVCNLPLFTFNNFVLDNGDAIECQNMLNQHEKGSWVHKSCCGIENSIYKQFMDCGVFNCPKCIAKLQEVSSTVLKQQQFIQQLQEERRRRERNDE